MGTKYSISLEINSQVSPINIAQCVDIAISLALPNCKINVVDPVASKMMI